MKEQTLKIFFIIVGWLSIILGVIGILLPLLPTTPFILLAAFCFARSSEKFHTWLLEHKLFGPIVQAWEEGKGIPKRTRNFAVLLMWSGMSLSAYLVWHIGATISLLIIGTCVSIYMFRLPSY